MSQLVIARARAWAKLTCVWLARCALSGCTRDWQGPATNLDFTAHRWLWELERTDEIRPRLLRWFVLFGAYVLGFVVAVAADARTRYQCAERVPSWLRPQPFRWYARLLMLARYSGAVLSRTCVWDRAARTRDVYGADRLVTWQHAFFRAASVLRVP